MAKLYCHKLTFKLAGNFAQFYAEKNTTSISASL